MDSMHQVIFWVGNALEAVILFRLALVGSFRRYLLFSSYLLFVLVRSLIDFWCLRFHEALYPRVYWYLTEPLSAILGTLVIFELYRKVLEFYPGVARMTRRLISIVLALVVSRFLVVIVFTDESSAGANVITLLRDLRIVQSAFLIGIVSLVGYYAIPIGRNLSGMIGGYGVYVGLVLFDLTLRSYLGDTSQVWWSYFHPSAYLLVLGVWTWSLWYPAPMPVKKADGALEYDYQALVDRTVAQLDRARHYFSKSVAP
jgi:hypothetical protein